MKTTNGTDRIDNVLGVFMHNRGIYSTSNGDTVRPLEFYALRKDPKDGKWFLLTAEEAAAYDMQTPQDEPAST